MNRQTYLANRFREVILNGTWIANTNFKKELENLLNLILIFQGTGG